MTYVLSLYESDRELSRGRTPIRDPEYYETALRAAFAEPRDSAALGRLSVICADLIEAFRQTDPSYGLVPVSTLDYTNFPETS